MEIKIRTSNHFHTATVKGEAAEALLALVLSNTKVGEAKDPNKKIFTLIDDGKFTITGDVQVMLFKDYYLVVS